MHPDHLAIVTKLPSAPALVALSFGVRYRHDVLLRGSARYTTPGKVRPSASVAPGWGDLCAIDSHRRYCAGPATRPGFTKDSTAGSACPLFKDCRT